MGPRLFHPSTQPPFGNASMPGSFASYATAGTRMSFHHLCRYLHVGPVSVIAVAQSLAICIIKLESQDAAAAVRTEKIIHSAVTGQHSLSEVGISAPCMQVSILCTSRRETRGQFGRMMDMKIRTSDPSTWSSQLPRIGQGDFEKHLHPGY